MRRSWVVVRREFLTRVKTKGFWLGLIFFPIFIVAIFIIPIWISSLKLDKSLRFVAIDFSGQVLDRMEAFLSDTTRSGKRVYVFLRKNLPSPAALEDLKPELNEMVENKEIDGYLVIPAGILDPGRNEKAQLYTKKVTDFILLRRMEDALNQAIQIKRFERSGIDVHLVAQLMKRVDLKTYKVGPEGEEEERGGTFFLAYVLALALYMGILLYGVTVMRAVLEEKSNRVAEMVVSSVRPFELMSGKILGVGFVAVVQFSIWAATMFVLSEFREPMAQAFGVSASAVPALPSVPLDLAVYFVIYFVLGFLLYSTMYAALGSTADSEQELQQLQTPLIFMLVLPILLLSFVIRTPDATLSVVLSILPFTSPIIMPARMAVARPPVVEILSSIVFLLAALLVMVWLAAKIYRVGILMYGKRASLQEIVKWVRYG